MRSTHAHIKHVLIRGSFLSSEPTILLTCGRDWELWPDPIFWAYAEYSFCILSQSDLTGSQWIRDFWCWNGPELSIPAIGQKDHGLWGQDCTWLSKRTKHHPPNTRAKELFSVFDGMSDGLQILLTRLNMIKQHQTRCPNGKMFGHQTMFDGVRSPNICCLSRA